MTVPKTQPNQEEDQKKQTDPMMADKEGDSKKRPKSANPDSPSKNTCKSKK